MPPHSSSSSRSTHPPTQLLTGSMAPSSSSSPPSSTTSTTPSASFPSSLPNLPPVLQRFLANLLTHPLVVPLISYFYASPFVLLWARVRLSCLIKGRKPQAPIAPSDAVAAALLDKKYGVHKYLQANGLRFHYVEKGSPSAQAPLVLFLHGFPEFWYTWRNQLQFLGTHGFHAVALDMRGYGWTEKPPEIEAYNLEVLVRDVREVIDALGYGPKEDGKEGRGCVLVGHDWGGTVAWAAAHVLGPSMIKGLCVMNCPHPKGSMEQATVAQFFKSWYFYFFQVPILPETMLSASQWYAIGASFRGKRYGVQRADAAMSETDLAVMKHAFSQRGVARGAVNYYRANMFRAKEEGMERAMEGRLAMPVLVVWGLKDRALGGELLVGMEKHVEEGGLRVETIADASHWVTVDATKETSELVWRFAVQVRTGGAGKGGETGKAGGGGGGGGGGGKTASSNL